ncbi:hypothetical protein [Candidatus Nitrospira neomarina]|uniref:Uncharacterized protein n=1 Tax=Candidatus Nitrospira neomarina TaxID=3020899 RepID=A0AA96GPB7_9BACT|nr:hypothetical protein [Candidatus Nitrospira neomarina]WNM63905.1 hypothetical protein PQG83_09150 [Candidatus Nitrospira neomarina]
MATGLLLSYKLTGNRINALKVSTVNTRRDQPMMYVDSRYINLARKSELLQHEHAMNQLRRQVAQLSKAVAWELEQHHSHLMELQQVEDTLTGKNQPAPATQPNPEPAPPSTGRWTKQRNHNHRSFRKPVAELVG